MFKFKVYKKLITITSILIIVCASFLFLNQGNSLNDVNFEIYNLKSYIVEERFKPKFSNYAEESIFTRHNDEILRITVIAQSTKQMAEKYASSQFFLFEGMYDQDLPPYPEFLTSATGCSDEFLPKKSETPYGSYYTVYAGDRFNYGICDHDVAEYKAGVGIFYCADNEEIIKLSYFLDKSNNFDTIDTLMHSFTCLNK